MDIAQQWSEETKKIDSIFLQSIHLIKKRHEYFFSKYIYIDKFKFYFSPS